MNWSKDALVFAALAHFMALVGRTENVWFHYLMEWMHIVFFINDLIIGNTYCMVLISLSILRTSNTFVTFFCTNLIKAT